MEARLARIEERQLHHFDKVETFIEEQAAVNQSHWDLKTHVDTMEAKGHGAWWAFGLMASLLVAFAAVVGWAIPTFHFFGA